MARHLTELIALVLLPLGGFIVVYALYTFVWRANAISQKKVRSRAWGAGRVEGVRRDKSGGGGLDCVRRWLSWGTGAEELRR